MANTNTNANSNVKSLAKIPPSVQGIQFNDVFPQSWCGIPMKELLTKPLRDDFDFLELAPTCTELVAEILETHSTTARLALAGRLSLALSSLMHHLDGELTKEQQEKLTIKERPVNKSIDYFSYDTDAVCTYCITLNNLLLSKTLNASNEKNIACLLFELVNILSENLISARYYDSAEGLRYVCDDSLVSL
ncbi:hypothetical protein ACI0YT_001285 [Cronobacter dublinensis]|uniref:hypothetical protein n=1 Tax=Cronobacter dublinensis TaxID=413497 RepID=UPI00131A358B|nr:hypothetical protein [Cronobacter dublinensis]ELQ6133076.1 hypothetical protein [Cronobacter dublinensis]